MESHFYHDFCIARNSFVISRLRNFHLNVLSRGSQCPNLSYKKALLDNFRGFILCHRSQETANLPNATGTFASKLQISTLRHFSKNTFLFYEMYNPTETSCINSSTLSKSNSYSLIALCCCGLEFKYLSVPTHTSLPYRPILPSSHSNLYFQPKFFFGIQRQLLNTSELVFCL